MTTDPLSIGCDACGAESGEDCRPLCVGVPDEYVAADGAWYDEDSDPWRGDR